MASAGWRNQADVPVLESVAAIFRQMMPDLPMPVTITRPRHSNSSWTALLEVAVDPLDEAENGGRLGAEHLLRQLQARGRTRRRRHHRELPTTAPDDWRTIAWIRTSRSRSAGRRSSRKRVLRVALRLRRDSRALP